MDNRIFTTFRVPLFVLLGIITSVFLRYGIHQDGVAVIILLTVIAVGSFQLLKETFQSLMKGQFALDYIALLAIGLGVGTGNFLVAAVIVLMLSGGNKLEEYAMNKAKSSLTALTERIPHHVMLVQGNQLVSIEQIEVNQEILVRKGEVIPLDGVLTSQNAAIDESSLTGEVYPVDKTAGDLIRSGTINLLNPIQIRVSKAEKDSTYRKIIEMVQQAQNEKPPLIRLANKYSTIFTILTLIIATIAYLISHDFGRVLAVLVIATPCPLILATPIALIGGMNAAARNRIIIKRLASIEVMSRVDTIIFDKTGTLTLGKPSLENVIITNTPLNKLEIIGIASAIEHNSLHPLAKAIVEYARAQSAPVFVANNLHEEIGNGIQGEVNGNLYILKKAETIADGMAIEMWYKQKVIATFHFSDSIKVDSTDTIQNLQTNKIALQIFTGDKLDAAQKLVEKLGIQVQIKANCTPQSKKEGIEELKTHKKTVAMVGDGINDAPALAYADVGMVFSNDEHTAASEAADVVFLGGNFSAVTQVLWIAKHTIGIAKQSIFVGIGLSLVGMVLAAGGYIPPIVGAFIQETIDIMVIINALRASSK